MGQLAITEGYLDNDGANKINLEQQRTDKRFGALAVKMGLMSEANVNALFQIQQTTRKFFGEILVEQHMISSSILDAQLKEHQRLKEQATVNLSVQVTQHEHATLINNTLNTIVKSFTRIPKIPAMVSDVTNQFSTKSDEFVAISQLAHVPQPIKIGLVIPHELIKKIGTNFLGFDVSNDEALYLDSISELLNIILGNVLVSNGSEQTQLEPPIIEQVNIDIQTPYLEKFLVDMSADGHNFTVFFMYE